MELLKTSQNIIVLTGAGVSVSCGIPDFRSRGGIYSRLEEFELDDPQQMFDIDYFRYCPQTFYSFAKEIYPSNFKPSPSHMFIKLLETRQILLRNYTQNIDTLEQVAGINRIIQCHGSFATASCITCGLQMDGKKIEAEVMAKVCKKVYNCCLFFYTRGGLKPSSNSLLRKFPIAKNAKILTMGSSNQILCFLEKSYPMSLKIRFWRIGKRWIS